VSSRVKSTGAFENLSPAAPRNFVFDPENERLLVGGAMKDGGQWGLSTSVGMNEDTGVGGELIRGPGGEYLTNEVSGHYGVNWTDAVRQQFAEFISRFGSTCSTRLGVGDGRLGASAIARRCGEVDRITGSARQGVAASPVAHQQQRVVGRP
jgi:hypothetical protein